MTTTAMKLNDPLSNALDFLRRFQRGAARFEIGETDDETTHLDTVATVPVTPAEIQDLRLLLTRLRRDYGLRKGDVLEILNNNDRLDIARITRRS